MRKIPLTYFLSIRPFYRGGKGLGRQQTWLLWAKAAQEAANSDDDSYPGIHTRRFRKFMRYLENVERLWRGVT